MTSYKRVSYYIKSCLTDCQQGEVEKFHKCVPWQRFQDNFYSIFFIKFFFTK